MVSGFFLQLPPPLLERHHTVTGIVEKGLLPKWELSSNIRARQLSPETERFGSGSKTQLLNLREPGFPEFAYN
ncbi:hypothetical protein CEXT_505281 [Caerostris extrusa]|uniref:Uncharacterized protein n=1 Tax=Caerostris extrusa TaxID=172846 RepID=A0AAV4UCX0_CAEEX|nr:hypothetical protein CEXT_505281 [Caerostris extrusa]